MFDDFDNTDAAGTVARMTLAYLASWDDLAHRGGWIADFLQYTDHNWFMLRELRVIASAKDTDDSRAAKICRDIAKAFEEQLTYPGEIKVTVVRESRFSEVAR